MKKLASSMKCTIELSDVEKRTLQELALRHPYEGFRVRGRFGRNKAAQSSETGDVLAESEGEAVEVFGRGREFPVWAGQQPHLDPVHGFNASEDLGGRAK